MTIDRCAACAGRATYIFSLTGSSVSAGIRDFSRFDSRDFDHMSADFPGDRAGALFKQLCDPLEREILFQIFLKAQTLFIGEKVRHRYSSFLAANE